LVEKEGTTNDDLITFDTRATKKNTYRKYIEDLQKANRKLAGRLTERRTTSVGKTHRLTNRK
jgi:hypothetical protein